MTTALPLTPRIEEKFPNTNLFMENPNKSKSNVIES